MSTDENLKNLHKALLNFNKRAERANAEILVSNFVDSEPLFDLLSTPNNQVVYGRRGTGKTHALKYLAEYVQRAGDYAIYLDLRSIGSNTSIYSDGNRSLTDRASTLIVDVLNSLYDEFYNIAVATIDKAPDPRQLTLRLDDLAASVSTIRISGAVEHEAQTEATTSRDTGISAKGAIGTTPSAEATVSLKGTSTDHGTIRVKRSGDERIHLDFGNISAAITGLAEVLSSPRIWLLIDEWSEIPIDLQPYLADLIKRTILPINSVTVKIASIEHRSEFILTHERGQYVGLEFGADVAADSNLDDFLVFDNNQEKAVEFFKKSCIQTLSK